MDSAQFVSLLLILIGQFYWTDRKLSEIRSDLFGEAGKIHQELGDIKTAVAVIGQKLDDHINSH